MIASLPLRAIGDDFERDGGGGWRCAAGCTVLRSTSSFGPNACTWPAPITST